MTTGQLLIAFRLWNEIRADDAPNLLKISRERLTCIEIHNDNPDSYEVTRLAKVYGIERGLFYATLLSVRLDYTKDPSIYDASGSGEFITSIRTILRALYVDDSHADE